jgi:nicotinamidase-related amidase
MQGTKWAEIADVLMPVPGDLVIGKTTYSPFVSTDIDEELRKRGIRRLYIAGLHTDCCARHTSGDAFQRGYDLVWITDGMQAFSDEAHQRGLEYFSAWYATDPARQLKTAEEVESGGVRPGDVDVDVRKAWSSPGAPFPPRPTSTSTSASTSLP